MVFTGFVEVQITVLIPVRVRDSPVFVLCPLSPKPGSLSEIDIGVVWKWSAEKGRQFSSVDVFVFFFIRIVVRYT